MRIQFPAARYYSLVNKTTGKYAHYLKYKSKSKNLERDVQESTKRIIFDRDALNDFLAQLVDTKSQHLLDDYKIVSYKIDESNIRHDPKKFLDHVSKQLLVKKLKYGN